MTYIELSSSGCISRMQSEKFNSHQVIARSDACRHVEVLPSLILYHAIHTPLPVVVRQTIFGDLEPSMPRRPSARSIVNLGEIDRRRSLMRGRNRMIGIVWSLRTANDVAPPCTYTVPSANIDDRVVLVLNAFVACELGIVHILNRLGSCKRKPHHWSRDTLTLFELGARTPLSCP